MRRIEGSRYWLGLHKKDKKKKGAKETEEQRHSMVRFTQLIEKA